MSEGAGSREQGRAGGEFTVAGLRDSDADCECAMCRPRGVDWVRAWGWLAAGALGALVWFGAWMWAVSG